MSVSGMVLETLWNHWDQKKLKGLSSINLDQHPKHGRHNRGGYRRIKVRFDAVQVRIRMLMTRRRSSRRLQILFTTLGQYASKI